MLFSLPNTLMVYFFEPMKFPSELLFVRLMMVLSLDTVNSASLSFWLRKSTLEMLKVVVSVTLNMLCLLVSITEPSLRPMIFNSPFATLSRSVLTLYVFSSLKIKFRLRLFVEEAMILRASSSSATKPVKLS